MTATATLTRRNSDSTYPGDWTSTDPDRAAAHLLPDEYVALRGMPSIKIMELLDRAWSRFADSDRRQVAQALLGILGPVDLGSPVTPEIRAMCERTIIQWRERIKTRIYQAA